MGEDPQDGGLVRCRTQGLTSGGSTGARRKIVNIILKKEKERLKRHQKKKKDFKDINTCEFVTMYWGKKIHWSPLQIAGLLTTLKNDK